VIGGAVAFDALRYLSTPMAAPAATGLAVLVALFKDDLVRAWHQPRLVARIEPRPPDCHKVRSTITGQHTTQCDAYYCRLWITNDGNRAAEDVQLFVEGIRRKHADGQFKTVATFMPMNLLWSYSREVYADRLLPGMGRHCDLLHILEPARRLSVGWPLPQGTPDGSTLVELDLQFKSNTMSHLLLPGEYEIDVKLAAANARPVSIVVEVHLKGAWYDSEDKMFSDGLGIRVR
jgi:hypothetical protein